MKYHYYVFQSGKAIFFKYLIFFWQFRTFKRKIVNEILPQSLFNLLLILKIQCLSKFCKHILVFDEVIEIVYIRGSEGLKPKCKCKMYVIVVSEKHYNKVRHTVVAKYKFQCNSPVGHSFTLHTFVSTAFPRRLHSLPPFLGAGFEHVRERDCVPLPQLFVHVVHTPQSE